MNYVSGIIAAVFLGAFATVAAAEPVVAKLQTPVAKLKRPIAGQAVFVCEGDTCTAATPTSGTNTVPGCRELVSVVGRVATFGSGAEALDATKLERCNAAARK